jgi:hypothetical protein
MLWKSSWGFVFGTQNHLSFWSLFNVEVWLPWLLKQDVCWGWMG